MWSNSIMHDKNNGVYSNNQKKINMYSPDLQSNVAAERGRPQP